MHTKTKKLAYAALCLALALVLPLLTGQIKQIGNMLCPMHLPVMLCGFLCGWSWGLAVGAVAPLLRSAIFGMPAFFPTALGMTFELAAYGLLTGLLYRVFPKKPVWTYVTLILAMIFGRLVWGLARFVMAGLTQSTFPFSAFLAGAVTNAIPGIILQLLLIPPVILGLKRAKLFPDAADAEMQHLRPLLTNRATVGGLDLLRRLPHRTPAHADPEANSRAFAAHEDALRFQGGFIEDQHSYSDLRYGKVNIAYAGCEIIAVYNALHDLCDGTPPFPILIREFEKNGMVLSGRLGSAPGAVKESLNRRGLRTELCTKEAAFDALADRADGLVLIFYNDRRNLFAQVHTVYVSKSEYGFTAHNLFGDGRPAGPVPELSALLKTVPGGRAGGIALIGLWAPEKEA